jgi:beta-glucanase (GH16 family)
LRFVQRLQELTNDTAGCPADKGLTSSEYISDFTGGALPSGWTATASGAAISYGADGATFTISQSGNNPTISTDFYMLFGSISVIMKAAPGTGIVSSVVLESDVLDEIDWEWIGGRPEETQTNYFGKGNTSTYDRELWVSAPASQSTLHNYTVNWQQDKTEWFVNGVLTRTLNYADANGGSNYPQTPMKLKIGTWAGGDTALNGEGTVTWAGGATDYSQGPFSAVVQSVQIINTNPASTYTYGDNSGSYSSIQRNSDAATWSKARRGVAQAFRA